MARCEADGVCGNDDCRRCGELLDEAYRRGANPGIVPPGAAPTGHWGGLFEVARAAKSDTAAQRAGETLIRRIVDALHVESDPHTESVLVKILGGA